MCYRDGVDVIDECCGPGTGGLSEDGATELADTFKVLADPTRLRLLALIANVSEGEICACDLTEPVGRSQATVSHHLSVLANAGLVTREQRGKWAWFRVAPEKTEFVRFVLAGGAPVPA